MRSYPSWIAGLILIANAAGGAKVRRWHIASYRCAEELGRYGGIADYARTCRWLTAVVNDPIADLPHMRGADKEDRAAAAVT